MQTDELKDLTVSKVSELFRQKKLSPVEYTKFILKEINDNRDLNAIVSVDEELALQNAKESEERYMKDNILSQIDGVVLGIKDIINTKDVITTYGCEAYSNYFPDEDAFVVKKLKYAGVDTSIKCNTSQFALGPTGEVSYKGAVKNARNPLYTTGGSSSGSASAVAAHILPGALGSDSGGSVRVPSSICGTVGIKPTFSLVSNEGVMPVSETVDCVGSITRTVEDGARILQVIAGNNPADWRSAPDVPYDYLSRLNESVKGDKAVVLDNLFEGTVHETVAAGCRNAVDVLKKCGMEIIHKDMPQVLDLRKAHQIHMLAMAHAYHLDDIAQNKEYIYEEVMKRLNSGTISSDEYVHYELKKNNMRKIVLDLLGDAECILYPTTPLTACKIGEGYKMVNVGNTQTCSYLSNGALTWASSFAGVPCINIPVGFNKEGLPIGISIMGHPFDEANLIRIANNLSLELGLDL